MRSIRTKITLLILAAIVVSVALAGGAGIYALKSEGDEDTAREMLLLCDNSCQSLDAYLNSVKQSVDMISRYAMETLSAVELMQGGVVGFDGSGDALKDRVWDSPQQRGLDSYLRRYVDGIGPMFLSIANHTKGGVAFYFRINPEFSQEVKGVFYSRSAMSGYEPAEMTEIFNYEAEDVDHVGWYTQTLRRGRPSWLDPYYNANIDVKMLSYTTPIYMAGTFIGLVGMDISFDMLISQVSDIRIFDTGFAALTDEEGRIIYHPHAEEGMRVEELSPELADTAAMMRENSSSQEIATYSYEGVARKMAFNTLSNGMKLMVVAPVREIDQHWHRFVTRIIGIAAAVMVAFIAVVTLMMSRITNPLKRLTEVAGQVMDGNYDVELNYDGHDEVGILTDAMGHLVDHLRVYISDLNSKVYRDSLTGIKNKSAYNLYVRKLDDLIAASPEGQAHRFAMVMFDCNDLKGVNDHFGHEKGDLYLQTASRQICGVFSHSPVFRLGGDEFAAVLQGEDFFNREQLLEQFDRAAKAINDATPETWKHVSIAKGCAVYDPALDHSAEDVLRRADEAMYRDKFASKQNGGRG